MICSTAVGIDLPNESPYRSRCRASRAAWRGDLVRRQVTAARAACAAAGPRVGGRCMSAALADESLRPPNHSCCGKSALCEGGAPAPLCCMLFWYRGFASERRSRAVTLSEWRGICRRASYTTRWILARGLSRGPGKGDAWPIAWCWMCPRHHGLLHPNQQVLVRCDGT